VQLGPVPAWSQPAPIRPEGVPRGSIFGRRRGEYRSTAAVADAEPARPNEVRREPQATPAASSIVGNASRRHDPRTAPGWFAER
jgi:hypothetical protein